MGNKRRNLRDIQEYDVTSNTYRLLPHGGYLFTQSRRNHMDAMLGKFMVVYGGVNDSCQNLNDLVAFDTENSTWQYLMQKDLLQKSKASLRAKSVD